MIVLSCIFCNFSRAEKYRFEILLNLKKKVRGNSDSKKKTKLKKNVYLIKKNKLPTG